MNFTLDGVVNHTYTAAWLEILGGYCAILPSFLLRHRLPRDELAVKLIVPCSWRDSYCAEAPHSDSDNNSLPATRRDASREGLHGIKRELRPGLDKTKTKKMDE